MELGKTWQMNFCGKNLEVSVGKYCFMSSGSCVVSCGDTMVMVNATMNKEVKDNVDFLPLSVDFEEKMYSVGKIPGGYKRREGKASDKGVLIARMIDRPLRPLFPKDFHNDVSLVATVLSVDPLCPPEPLALVASSIALCISEIPFDTPVGSVKVACQAGKYIINPSSEELEDSEFDLMVCGVEDRIIMLEAGAKEVSNEKILEGIEYAKDYISQLITFQNKIIKDIKPVKYNFKVQKIDSDIEKEFSDYSKPVLEKIYAEQDKKLRGNLEDLFVESSKKAFYQKLSESEIHTLCEKFKKQYVRDFIINTDKRIDGRSLDEVRPIWCEVGVLPRVHGSGVFTRGKTQVLTTLTLGTMREAQELDSIDDEVTNRYMHHYNMPPYATNEAKPLRAPGRREIGHGALAEKALEPVLPNEDDFPYAIRVVSEVLSSNGSTSQASICGSTLALMDGGVPISSPVAGIAVGLIQHGGEDIFLTDIQGLEDFYGDMDLKIAGSKKGITAIQMDLKVKGISIETLRKAFEVSRKGREYILDEMAKTIVAPRVNLSQYAPKITSFKINPDKIRDVIGSGGKTINKIIEETGVKIDISDEGLVQIATHSEEKAKLAISMIKEVVAEVEVGVTYDGVVTRIAPFGAFVEIMKGREGMIHISKLSTEHVEKVEDVVKKGDKVKVIVLKIDEKKRIDLRLVEKL